MIAMSAKMAKADGVVTQNEVETFGDIFDVPPTKCRTCGASSISRSATSRLS